MLETRCQSLVAAEAGEADSAAAPITVAATATFEAVRSVVTIVPFCGLLDLLFRSQRDRLIVGTAVVTALNAALYSACSRPGFSGRREADDRGQGARRLISHHRIQTRRADLYNRTRRLSETLEAGSTPGRKGDHAHPSAWQGLLHLRAQQRSAAIWRFLPHGLRLESPLTWRRRPVVRRHRWRSLRQVRNRPSACDRGQPRDPRHG